MSKKWFITGVSSGFGYEMATQLLESGHTVIGTVRNTKKIENLITKYPETFDCRILDVTDVPAVRATVKSAFTQHGKIDVIVSNAGYGLFGAAEELNDEDVNHIIATNLTGSIAFIRAALPYLRKQGGGNIIQISSYAGQVAMAGNSVYHATKFGIEGFCESVAQEMEKYNVKVTIVEPGASRTEFRYSSAKVAILTPAYEHVHGFLNMMNPLKRMQPGDPKKVAARIIESVDNPDTPLHLALGAEALETIIGRLEERVAIYKTQTEIAATTDFVE